jgi:hypothetical protein
MKTTLTAGIVCLAINSGAQAQQSVQWKVSDGGNGHWYQRVPRSTESWSQMRDLARSRSSELASISSQVENDFVLSISRSAGEGLRSAIGGENPGGICGGSWRWTDGTAFSFSNWDEFQPECAQEEIVVMYPTGRWHDYPRTGMDGYWTGAIIEWSADCNGDGIVDYGQCHDGTLPDYNGNNIPDCCERGETCVVGNYPVQWRVEDGGNGHWYGFGAIAVSDASWMQMRDGAVAMGGHLLTLSSAVEDDFVFDLWRASQPFQGQDMMAGPLGYFVMPGGSWQSVNGEPMTYTNWRPATTAPPLLPAPDNGNAVHRFATWLSSDWGPLAGRWEDWLDSELGNPGDPISPFMVEWDADCNSDGIVDYGQILQGQLADLNADGIPDICQQPTCVDADLFRNGVINGADLGILLSQWGPAPAGTVSDINRDGQVSGADLGFLLNAWGPCSN